MYKIITLSLNMLVILLVVESKDKKMSKFIGHVKKKINLFFI